MKNKSVLGIIISLALFFAATSVLTGQASTAVIWTDKADYMPGETVTVTGSGFVHYDYYDIPVIRPDGNIVLGDGSDTAGWDTIQADESGNLAYGYQLNGIAGLYEVRVYDSPWSGSLDQEALATTTFTDAQAAANLDQVRNGAGTSPWDPGVWVNGNAGEQNSHYLEGWSIPYRVRMTDLPTGTSITLTLGYDIKHSGRNAIDYLTTYERLDPYHYDSFGHNPEEIDPLIGVSGVSGTVTTHTIPAPGSTNSPVTDQPTQSYDDLVTSEGPGSVEMTLFGGTITDISYNVEGDLTASQAETRIDVTFTVDSSTAVLAWGGHIASRLDWGYDEGGVPRSAGGISGSPYHMRLIDWYGETPEITKLLGNLGNQDRSLSAQAVYEPPVWPELDIDKVCSAKTLVGGDITFTVILTNTGTQDAEGVEVTDTLPAGVSYTPGTATATSGTIDDSTPGLIVWTGTILKDGGTVTITIPVVAITAGEKLNYAEYTAYPDNTVLIHTSASCSTPVYNPGISLTKSADPVKILSGASVTFTYVVENTGDLALSVDLVDDQFGTIASGESLAVGQTKTFTYTTTIADDVTNEATATGGHQLGSVSDTDSASVDVIHPDISVTKTCTPETQLPLGTITWTIVVENTGDVDLIVTVEDSMHGTVFGPATIAVGGSETIVKTDVDLPAGVYTNTVTATGAHQLGEVTATASATCTVEELYLKKFIVSGALNGFTKPIISCDGLCSVVFELHSGPRIWWQVDYYFENSEEYLGEQFDPDEGHYFILWDKWGGNLMALPSPPTAFDPVKNEVTLENGNIFKIDYNTYKAYVGEGIPLTNNGGGTAWITLHTGDQQEGTNPGNGNANSKDGKSYDTDVRWEIGWLEPGESRKLTLYIAPGKNPGGKLQFSSSGCFYINTGPRVRVYADEYYEDFLYAIDRTNKLKVCVLP